ncbi:MAG: nucleotidyltransferase domain-containing protein [Candidatus Nanopelagicales bacterium]
MTTLTTTITSGCPAADRILDEARRLIEVVPAELAEARSRRSDIASALRSEFPGCRIYVNGSIAHGDANTPLSDLDLGIVVPDPDHQYGQGKLGPSALQERAADAIRRDLKDKYDGLIVELQGKKRAILVRFRDPVTPGQPDFTADVIVAIDNPNDSGLFIPLHHMWDRSHPEMHTELILDANEESRASYARAVRLIKHWNKHNGRPLSSWHIKALALGVLVHPMSMSDAILAWFEHAVFELKLGDTEDPAHVADKPIKTRIDRDEAIDKVDRGRRQLAEAFELANDGYLALAQDMLSKWMNDPNVLPAPPKADVIREGSRRLGGSKGAAAATLVTGLGAGIAAARPAVRSWGE